MLYVKRASCMSLTFFRRYKFLIVILVFAVIVRTIWLMLTVIGDEGELGYDAMLWSRGEIPYTVRFSEKPPLAYFIYMAFITFFGNTVIPIRIFNSVLFFISIIAFYLLVKNWHGKKVGLVASFIYVFFLNAPAFWGPCAVAIHLSMPFTIFSVLTCNKYVETGKITFLIVSGIFLSIAGLIRLNSFVVGIVLLAILILSKRKRPVKSYRKFLASLASKIFVLIIGISVPLLLALSYFWAIGILDKVIYNVLIRPIVEVSPEARAWNPPFGWQFLGLMEGLPILVFTILGGLASVFIRMRQNIYVIIWLLAPLTLLFALEPRDSYHFSVIAPAASILSAFALCLSLEGFYHIKRNNHLSITGIHRMKSIFILTIFILSLLVSLYFQAQQFPSGTIRWEFIDWEYSRVGDYNKIMELIAYLKSLNLSDGEVLIQDWLPYIYWLTGIKAPSIHLNTYQRGLGIPLAEYERLFTEVKERKIPYVIVLSKMPKGSDPITDFVRDNYFPLKSIGGVDIFSASYPIEKDVFFSFVAKLNEARAYALLSSGEEKPLEEVSEVVIPRIEKLTVNNETKYAIRQHPLVIHSNITYSSIKIPPNATLEFSIAIHPKVWIESGDGVLFEIILGSTGQKDKIFSEYIDPKNNVEDRKWHYYRIPLEEYSNKVVSISFITNPGPAGDSNWDWAYWGDPLIRY